MKFNRAKCKFLCLVETTQSKNTGWEKNGLRADVERDLGLLVDEKVNVIQHCAFAVQKANCILGCQSKET